MKQLAAWLGGAVFVAVLALTAWWFLVPLGRRVPFDGSEAVVADTALFAAFAVHHSVLARDSSKAWVARWIPAALVRTLYVWTASLLLAAAIVLWRTVGGELYQHTGWAAFAHAGIELVGVGLIARATRAIDPLELAGIRQAVRRSADAPLQTTGPYRWVRHPLYLGWLLAVWGHPHMTGDRALFAAITTIYLAIAVPFEERSLVDSFGEAYREYQRKVRWRMLPYVY
jgi:methanethiol S-methyltransferase